MRRQDELVFVPLGGLGEIGMNAALYGFGPAEARKWILVDCGMGFAARRTAGRRPRCYPDLRFIEGERDNLLGIFITHAHEDHIGALVELWPRLRVPVYATRFAIGLLETRRLAEPGAPKVDLREIVARAGASRSGPSRSSTCRSRIRSPNRTRSRSARRTASSSIPATGRSTTRPIVGSPTSEERSARSATRACWRSSATRPTSCATGRSPSESDVASASQRLIADAPQRVAVTTFASNVARIRAVAEAAQRCGREVVVVGRAMDRVIDVARECGYLDGLPEFRPPDAFGYLPRDKVVALLTGSQGEPRAALARIADDEHPGRSRSSPGDRVIFSSRTIPGNEKAVGTHP